MEGVYIYIYKGIKYLQYCKYFHLISFFIQFSIIRNNISLHKCWDAENTKLSCDNWHLNELKVSWDGICGKVVHNK